MIEHFTYSHTLTNRLLNPGPLQLSELALGNVLRSKLNYTSSFILQRIGLDGSLLVSDRFSGLVSETHVTDVMAIEMGESRRQLAEYLRGTPFVWKSEIMAEMPFGNEAITLKSEVLKSRWVMFYSSADLKVFRPIYYVHEMQNCFTFITGEQFKNS